MSNRIYLKENSKLQDDFKLIAKEVYDSDILETNFKKDPKQLVEKINKWIEMETRNTIKDTFKEIGRETVMLLINVVYFKAKWMKPFSKSNVRPRKFTNLDGKKKKVDTMSDLDYHHYGQFEQYKILRLDYFSNCSMYIVLPNEEINLNDFIINLDSKKLNEDLNQIKSTYLDVKIPKFTFKTHLTLNNILQKMGVGSIFNLDANLSKISNETNLVVTDAAQEAFINVDEDGTEAAAVTYLTLSMRSMHVGEEFYANRPFLFLIRLNDVNIFAGAVKKFE